MTKKQNIFELYELLNKAGQRGEAQRFIANLCDVKVGTVKNHWFQNKEMPDHVEEWKEVEIITFLQNQIAIQNEVA